MHNYITYGYSMQIWYINFLLDNTNYGGKFVMSKKKINCNVVNCKFNDDEEYLCCLDDIEISCTCNNEKCKNKKETICNSFEEKDKKEE